MMDRTRCATPIANDTCIQVYGCAYGNAIVVQTNDGDDAIIVNQWFFDQNKCAFIVVDKVFEPMIRGNVRLSVRKCLSRLSVVPQLPKSENSTWDLLWCLKMVIYYLLAS